MVFLSNNPSFALIYCALIRLSLIIALPLAALVSHISPLFITSCQSSVRPGRLTHETLEQLQARSMVNKTQQRTENGQINASSLVCNMKQASHTASICGAVTHFSLHYWMFRLKASFRPKRHLAQSVIYSDAV